jgi:hypothetical protein
MRNVFIKFLKSIFAISVSILVFFILSFIALYIYLGKGLTIPIDQSNDYIQKNLDKYGINFNPSSELFLSTKFNEIEVYLSLYDFVLSSDNKESIKAEKLNLSTQFPLISFYNLALDYFSENNSEIHFIFPLIININNAIVDIAALPKSKNDVEIGEKNEELINAKVIVKKSKLYDNELFLGNFDASLGINIFEKNSKISSFSLNVNSGDTFDTSYLLRFFPDVKRLSSINQVVQYDLKIQDSNLNDSIDSRTINGNININHSEMELVKFPAQLKPEVIRNLNISLNIKDSIGSINLVGTVTNPKQRIKLQKEANLQVSGKIILKDLENPELDLFVNGSDIYFAKLDNENLNGVSDLKISITGQETLKLDGDIRIKKSNGFLTPLKDTKLNVTHQLREKNEQK